MYRSTKKDKMQGVSRNSDAQLFHASNIMERDTEQSHRLHEPTSISSHTDPITGNDVMGTTGHPSIVDGILTVYFESGQITSYVAILFLCDNSCCLIIAITRQVTFHSISLSVLYRIHLNIMLPAIVHQGDDALRPSHNIHNNTIRVSNIHADYI